MEVQLVMWLWTAFIPDIRLVRVGVETGQA